MKPTGQAQRVVITGASSGIGAALARHYGRGGATLGLIARRKAALEQLAGQLAATVELYAADVRDARAMADAAGAFVSGHGPPDIVIANAGVSVGTLTDCADDTRVFQEVLETNLTGVVNTFQPFLAPMREAGRGALVGIASVAGYRGLPGAGAYSASKAGLIAYLESLRVELRASGVTVTTICPGYIATPLTAGNPYPMPFLMSTDRAADRIGRIIAGGTSFAVFPWPMALVARFLHVMPHWLYDRLAANAPHKPRRQ